MLWPAVERAQCGGLQLPAGPALHAARSALTRAPAAAAACSKSDPMAVLSQASAWGRKDYSELARSDIVKNTQGALPGGGSRPLLRSPCVAEPAPAPS